MRLPSEDSLSFFLSDPTSIFGLDRGKNAPKRKRIHLLLRFSVTLRRILPLIVASLGGSSDLSVGIDLAIRTLP